MHGHWMKCSKLYCGIQIKYLIKQEKAETRHTVVLWQMLSSIFMQTMQIKNCLFNLWQI